MSKTKNNKRMVAVDWAWKEEKVAVWNGTGEMKSKLPKPEDVDLIVTENAPPKLMKPFLDAGVPVMRCSGNSSADHRTSLGYKKDHTPLGDKNDAWIIRDLYKCKPEKFRPMKPPTPLKLLYVNYYQLIKQIAAVKNRQWASDDEDNKEYLEGLEKAKNLLLKKMRRELKKYKVWTEFGVKIKGVGPALVAGLVAEIQDIGKFDNVSNLNAYGGVHVEDGKCVARKKGEVYPVNSRLKSLVTELIPSQFVRHKTPVYRGIYDAEKAKSAAIMEADKDLPKDERRVKNGMHVERRARRKAGKIFLHHFWKEWRLAEGLPVPLPWILEQGGHSKEILPPTAYPGHDQEEAA